MICERCGWFAPDDCTCRMNPETARQQWLGIQARHRDAVERAQTSDRWARMRAAEADRRAS